MSRSALVAVLAAAVVVAAIGWHLLRGRPEPLHDDDPIVASSVVMLGDSITEHGDWSDLVDETVVNRGFSGFTTAQLVPVAHEIAADRPHTVFVLTGTNDIRDDHPPAWTVEHLDAILSAFRTISPRTRIVVQTVLPRADARAAVGAVNAAVAHLADERGVELLDLHSTFDDGTGALRPSETDDGVHLTAAGYARWATLLRTFIDAPGGAEVGGD